MAKRNSAKRDYVWVNSPIQESDLLPPVEEDLSGKVPIQLQKDLILNYTGPVTKTLYQFEGAGSIVYVYEEDVELMLQKRSNVSCCSGQPPLLYFKRV